MSAIRVAILTVSDTASADSTADRSGPTIKQILEDHGGFECSRTFIVPDDEWQITSTVKGWCDSGDVDCVFTTGGTGFGVRDRTPEAISPLIERPAPGLVHLLMSTSITHTPLAALSRPVAGTYKNTLIVTLPGSVKAVKENLSALLVKGLLGHAVELFRGGSGNIIHGKLAKGEEVREGDVQNVPPRSHVHHGGKDDGHDGCCEPLADLQQHHHHHHHHHGHGHGHNIPKPRGPLSHDPSQAASTRHRVSPYPIIALQEALGHIIEKVQPLGIEKSIVSPRLQGHILAEDVYAPQNVPPTQTTNVDGYAIRSTDEPGTYKVLTSKTHHVSQPIPTGYIYRVNTGGPIPSGTDTVIMVEDTKLVSTFTSSDQDAEEGEEKEVETLAKIPKGENVRQPGSDVVKGDLVLKKGELLRSAGGEIGTLAFVGRKEIQVFKKPVVAVMSTGNEIIDLHDPVALNAEGQWGGIWDTNRPSLSAALQGLGYEVVDLGVVPDDVQAHVKTIKRGLEEADILLTTGGTSMGPSDLLKPVIERHFNGTVHFGRSAMKPGKPTTFATVPFNTDTGTGTDTSTILEKPIFALPGNPASALVTFHVYVIPALRKLGGWQDDKCHLPRVMVKIQNPMPLDPRVEFHRVLIKACKDGSLKAFSTGGQRSSRVASLSGANGLAVLPPKSESQTAVLPAGSVVEAMVIGEILVEV